MSVVGIIAEYNPFHNGHKYQIQKALEITGADHVVIVMSGNFVQRGAPAIINKYTRANYAINNGASLVLELPVCYSTASAELFASSAVTLLNKIGVVDYLSFGCEDDNLSQLQNIADILIDEPDDYKMFLKKYLSDGLSYPLARSNALSDFLRQFSEQDDYSRTISTPNNILAIEYLKAIKKLNSSIIPAPVKRCDSGFHSLDIAQVPSYLNDTSNLTGKFASATAIRNMLTDFDSNIDNLADVLPDNCLSSLTQNLSFVESEDFSLILGNELYTHNDFSSFSDISSFLSNRINNFKINYHSFNDFASALMTKNETRTHINRALTHIMLGINSQLIQSFINDGCIFYAMPLAFRNNTGNLLKDIKKNSSIDFIDKFSSFYNGQSGLIKEMLDLNLKSDNLYRMMYKSKCGKELPTDFTVKITR